jgi:hypothetical protein
MVSIDTVYQRVLGILNKEQRGYITPQEFNLLANQAQMDIFEQYFYDINAFSRIEGNDTTYSDMLDLLQEKIDIFEKYRVPVVMSSTPASAGQGTLPEHYRMGELYNTGCTGGQVEIEKIQQNQILHIQNSPLTAPTTTRPVYVRASNLTPTDDSAAAQTSSTSSGYPLDRVIQVYPTSITSGVVCNYIARPQTVEWTYVLVNGYPMYNNTNVKDFELHQSEETELIIKILALGGIVLNDPNAYQLATAEDTKNQQQEKQ